MNPGAQAMTIAYMILCGGGIGLAFDAYRVVVNRFRAPRWMLPGLDIAFWTAAAVWVFSVLQGSNQGEVRMYVFLGLGIGVTAYFGLVSKWMVVVFSRALQFAIALFQNVWKVVKRLVVDPILWIVRMLAKLLDVLFIVAASVLLWTVRLAWKPGAALAGRLKATAAPLGRRIRKLFRRKSE